MTVLLLRTIQTSPNRCSVSKIPKFLSTLRSVVCEGKVHCQCISDQAAHRHPFSGESTVVRLV